MAHTIMTGEADTRTVDGRWTPLRVAVIAICFLLNAIDGMDIVIMSYIAPSLKASWELGPEALGIVFSASLAGMAVGGLFIAPLADRFGRRPLILALLTVITVSMLLSSQAQNVTQLVLLRTIIGMSVGAFLASVTTLAAEYAPRGQQGLVVGAAIAGYPMGAVITGLVVAHTLPIHGWRMMLAGAGCVSLIVLPLVLLILPESIDYLKRMQPANALSRLNRVLGRLGEPTLPALPPRTEAHKTSPAEIFRDGRLSGTICLWVAIIMGFMTFYFLVSWITQLSVQSGLAVENAIYAGALFNLGGFIGTFIIAAAGARMGLQRATCAAMLCGAVVVAAFGYLSVSLAVTLVLAFFAGFTTNGGFNSFYALAAGLYPSEIRSTGIGWAMGIGRIGAVIGPMLGGILIGRGLGLPALLAVFAIPLLVAGVAALFVRNRIRQD
ncbi:MAG TPA: MFS transporter [Paracoccus sp. (in: a-proteobacteria)]|uniref:MFS transporter n=1 Tax=Paracoccus sp. TaxID=267 RepID=UPI002C1F041E|nr:MFS transporter [Paracoccus sp. (in: a-proteobacteria)]HWL55236.1 MFS transporter [Paracoccus sp. (in: a-proteobacteria)]